jgi:GxxExxY protein
MLIHARITEAVIGAAIEVHKTLGPGLLEHVYEECLCYELSVRGFNCDRQAELPVRYKGVSLDCGYRMDLVVENLLLVEWKCVEALLPVHEAQLMTYLRLSGHKVGLLMNFYVPALKDGIIRRVR